MGSGSASGAGGTWGEAETETKGRQEKDRGFQCLAPSAHMSRGGGPEEGVGWVTLRGPQAQPSVTPSPSNPPPPATLSRCPTLAE